MHRLSHFHKKHRRRVRFFAAGLLMTFGLICLVMAETVRNSLWGAFSI